MNRLNRENEKNEKSLKSILVPLVTAVVLIIIGVIGIVTNRLWANEYKNSNDIKFVPAVVYDVTDNAKKYRSGEDNTEYWFAKFTYEIDGVKYKGQTSRFSKTSIGDTIKVEVYKTSNGKYRTTANKSPLNFAAYCLSALFGVILLVGTFINPKAKNEKSEKKKQTKK